MEAQCGPDTLGNWLRVGDLIRGRFAHTASLLEDGRVLVAAGQGKHFGANPTYEVEIYDPVSLVWTAGERLRWGRREHTATVLSDGRVLVAGGGALHDLPLTEELYDPASGHWVETEPMIARRSSATATLLADGRVLMVGGWWHNWEPLATAEIFDPVTGSWAPTGSLDTARGGHTATLLADGRVLVAGGADSSHTVIPTAELYDPLLGIWTPAAPLAEPRARHTASPLMDGRILVTGGDAILLPGVANAPLASVEIYDPTTGMWSPGAPMIHIRTFHTATALSDGSVLVVGGDERSIGGDGTAELFDPVTQQWSEAGSIGGRLWHTATLLEDGTALVAGGVPSQTAWLYCGPAPNQPPVASCRHVSVEAGPECTAQASIDAGSFDPDGDEITLTQEPPGPYGLGETEVELTVGDGSLEDTCGATVTVVDETTPEVWCNAPQTITPPATPVTITAAASDNCGVGSVLVRDPLCYQINAAGKWVRVPCHVSIEGGTITILNSGGVGTIISWEVLAEDAAGNTASVSCEVDVVNPGQGHCQPGESLHLAGWGVGWTEIFESCGAITATDFRILAPDGDVTFRAGEGIELGNGFGVESGCGFTAQIDLQG